MNYDTIHRRLKNQAASKLNGALSPEHNLFINEMASGFSELYRGLTRSEDVITRRIEQRLTPDTTTRPRPAHALVYAQPLQNGYVLGPDEDVFNVPRLGQTPPNRIFFAPLLPVPLVKARVRYLVAGQSLREVDAPTAIQQRIAGKTDKGLHPGMLWVGIESKVRFTSPQALCFCFDWKTENQMRTGELNHLLPLISWHHGADKLTGTKGLQFDSQAVEKYASGYVDDEFMHIYQIEQQILKHYDPCFVTVQCQELRNTPPPEEVAGLFPEEDLQEVVKGDLIWLKLLFPAGFKPEEIQNTVLQLNCFPVVNRKLDRTRDFMPAAQNGCDTITLSNAERGKAALNDQGAYFLGFQRTFTRSTQYRPIVFEHFSKAPLGSYALQHGHVEADDYRDLYDRIDELCHLIQRHTSTLTLLDQNEVAQGLDKIKSGVGELQINMQKIPPKDLDLGYFLHVKALDPQDMIYVRFWITQGEYAEGIGTPGDKLDAERTALLEGDMAWWVG